jgi:hypothetical protein
MEFLNRLAHKITDTPRYRGNRMELFLTRRLRSIAVASFVIWTTAASAANLRPFDAPFAPLAVGSPKSVPAGAVNSSIDPDNPCGEPSSYPPPAYPRLTYTAQQIEAMFIRPDNVTQLLWNLKLVHDRKLLVQPSFFEEAVLLKLFNGTGMKWVKPGTPDVAGDWVIKPTRIARITLGGDVFSGMKVDVGLNHKCLNRRIDPTNQTDQDAYIPPHTYDSGYIRLRFEAIEGFTLGAARRVFGPNPGHFDVFCKEPPPLTYQALREPGSDVFLLNLVQFGADEIGYEEVCRSKSRQELTDEDSVRSVVIRLIEQDYTFPTPKVF